MNAHGNGVGLSICKNLCEGLEGSIKVDSELGFGSTFTFTMRAFKVQNDKKPQFYTE